MGGGGFEQRREAEEFGYWGVYYGDETSKEGGVHLYDNVEC